MAAHDTTMARRVVIATAQVHWPPGWQSDGRFEGPTGHAHKHAVHQHKFPHRHAGLKATRCWRGNKMLCHFLREIATNAEGWHNHATYAAEPAYLRVEREREYTQS